MTFNLRNKDIGVIAILIVASVSLSWFRGDNLLWGADTSLPLDLRKSIDRYFYIWSYKDALGGVDARKFAFLMPLGFLLEIYNLSSLPFSPLIFQGILVYLLLAASGLSAYFLGSLFFDEKKIESRLIVALFYMLNFYSLVVIWSPLSYIVFQYAFLPLILALYIKGVSEKKSLKYATIVALVWSLSATPGYMTTSIVVTDWFIIALYLVFHILTSRKISEAKRAVAFTFYLFIAWSAMNMFWLMPAALFSSEELTSAQALAQGIDLYNLNSASILDALRLTGYWALKESYKGSSYFPWYAIYETAPFMILSLVTPIMVWLAFLLKPRSRHVIFFSLVSLIALLIVKGSYPPLGELNLFIFSRLGLVTAFRSNYQRFMEYVVLGYSVLLGVTVDRLLAVKFKQPHINTNRYMKRFLHTFPFLTLVFVICGVYVWPFWTADLYSAGGVIPSKRVKIPTYYYEAANWLDEQTDDFNVLPLPFGKVLSVYWWENGTQGYLGMNPFLLLSSKPNIVRDYNELAAHSVSLIINRTVNNVKILNLLNVKYLIFHRDSAWDYIDGHDWWISSSPEKIQSVLNSQGGLSLEKAFGQIDIYLNEYWVPSRIYPASNAILVSGGLREMIKSVERDDFALDKSVIFLSDQLETEQNSPLPPINSLNTNSTNNVSITSEEIDPTKYTVDVSASRPFFLVLSESYHKDWVAYVNGQQIPNKYHYLANGFANSWYINKTGSFTIILEFWPQRLFYVGVMISLATFILCTIYVSKDKIKIAYSEHIRKAKKTTNSS